MNYTDYGGQVRTPKLSLEGGGQLRTPKLSLADAGGGAPPLVTLSLFLRFFLWCGFPEADCGETTKKLGGWQGILNTTVTTNCSGAVNCDSNTPFTR